MTFSDIFMTNRGRLYFADKMQKAGTKSDSLVHPCSLEYHNCFSSIILFSRTDMMQLKQTGDGRTFGVCHDLHIIVGKRTTADCMQKLSCMLVIEYNVSPLHSLGNSCCLPSLALTSFQGRI